MTYRSYIKIHILKSSQAEISNISHKIDTATLCKWNANFFPMNMLYKNSGIGCKKSFHKVTVLKHLAFVFFYINFYTYLNHIWLLLLFLMRKSTCTGLHWTAAFDDLLTVKAIWSWVVCCKPLAELMSVSHSLGIGFYAWWLYLDK